MGAKHSAVKGPDVPKDKYGTRTAQLREKGGKNFKIGQYAMIVEKWTDNEAGSKQLRTGDKVAAASELLRVGRIIARTHALERNHFEYSIQVEDLVTECWEEQFIYHLKFDDLSPWVNRDTREVAVHLETHGAVTFLAEVIQRNADRSYDVRFKSDRTVLQGVTKEHLSQPDESTVIDASPDSTPPDPSWLQDRKSNIDDLWPMHLRLDEALRDLELPRLDSVAPLCGPFTGKRLFDSEGFPAHPSPVMELQTTSAKASFIETWAKFAGKIKFATTYKIGIDFPRSDVWVDQVDAGDPLYFHAALPVHAGLICIGEFRDHTGRSHPEWVRACDFALVGVALYVSGDREPSLYPGEFQDPPHGACGDGDHARQYCNFIPGCVSTYLADYKWVGASFCLAPMESDYEILDDIHNIEAYHDILNSNGYSAQEIKITVNLVLSTDYQANLRQCCAGSIRVQLSPDGLHAAKVRLQDVRLRRLESSAAHYPKRRRKSLAVDLQDKGLAPTPTFSAAVQADGRSKTGSAAGPALGHHASVGEHTPFALNPYAPVQQRYATPSRDPVGPATPTLGATLGAMTTATPTMGTTPGATMLGSTRGSSVTAPSAASTPPPAGPRQAMFGGSLGSRTPAGGGAPPPSRPPGAGLGPI